MVHTPASAAGWSPAASSPERRASSSPSRRDAPPAPYPGPDDPGHQLQGGLRRVPDGELDLGRLLPRRDHSRGALPCHRPLGPEGRCPPRQHPGGHGADLLRVGDGAARRRAHWSKAKIPRASVAVVRTACPPSSPAISRARSLAPPRWPERMGTANRPSSSTTTTAGSRALLTRWGATDRTAIPAAPTKIRPPRGGRRRRSTPPPARPSGYRRRGARSAPGRPPARRPASHHSL